MVINLLKTVGFLSKLLLVSKPRFARHFIERREQNGKK